MKLIHILLFFALLYFFSPLFESFMIGIPLNVSTRFTRNQSYDLRGDPFPNPYYGPGLSPWNMSTIPVSVYYNFFKTKNYALILFDNA